MKRSMAVISFAAEKISSDVYTQCALERVSDTICKLSLFHFAGETSFEVMRTVNRKCAQPIVNRAYAEAVYQTM